MQDIIDNCWPVDTSCSDTFESDYDADTRAKAIALAGLSMRMLTGYSVGGCPVLLRPCARGCVDGADGWYSYGAAFRPHIDSQGQWLNGCGCSNPCSCTALSEVILPSYAREVLSVQIGTQTLPTTAYRVDNHTRLVRTDGEKWPNCQEMAAAPGTAGAFVVTYLPGKKVDALGAQAAGLLAIEFAKACTGKKCSLPRNTTSIVRQGVSVEMSPGIFPEGVTNIPQVDAYLKAYNPYKLAMPSAIYSPDQRRHRVTTWTG